MADRLDGAASTQSSSSVRSRAARASSACCARPWSPVQSSSPTPYSFSQDACAWWTAALSSLRKLGLKSSGRRDSSRFTRRSAFSAKSVSDFPSAPCCTCEIKTLPMSSCRAVTPSKKGNAGLWARMMSSKLKAFLTMFVELYCMPTSTSQSIRPNLSAATCTSLLFFTRLDIANSSFPHHSTPSEPGDGDLPQRGRQSSSLLRPSISISSICTGALFCTATPSVQRARERTPALLGTAAAASSCTPRSSSGLSPPFLCRFPALSICSTRSCKRVSALSKSSSETEELPKSATSAMVSFSTEPSSTNIASRTSFP
mmetsp:Transcript_21669/g.40227  ORF Transcript_21669/g.40227 Transcript_21669/m.40227 type:complete len:315 (-) Transcript_21669:375-1319(-)